MRHRIALTGIMLAVLGGSTPIAAADQSPAPPSGTAGPNPPWIAELPSVAAVEATIHGATPHETAIRVSATLDVLMNLIDVFSGNRDLSRGHVVCPWPDGAKRAKEYGVAEYVVIKGMVSHEPRVPGKDLQFSAEVERGHLVEDKNFAGEILKKFVSRSSRDAYFTATAEWYERLDAVHGAVKARQDPGSTTEVDCADARMKQAYGLTEEAKQLRARCETKKRAAAERTNAERVGARDTAKARAVGVSTNVFGLPLGEPFAIPDCPEGAMGDIAASLSGVTCRSQTVSLEEGFWEIILSQSKRPPWVTSAGVTVEGGVLMGVAIATADGDPAGQIAALRDKYGRPRPAGEALEWQLAGLYVRYEPRAALPEAPNQITGTTVGGITNFHVGPSVFASWRRANIPNLFIMLESFRDAQKATQQRHKAQEPRL